MAVTESQENRVASRLSKEATDDVYKDFNFEYFIYSNEGAYNAWFTIDRIKQSLHQIEDDGAWNCLVSFLIISCLILVSADISDTYVTMVDIAFNVIYAVHVIFTTLERLRQARQENVKFTMTKKCALVFDVLSYLHYVSMFTLSGENHRLVKTACYYVRLHTSFSFLWAMTGTNLKGSLVFTALKFCFIFLVTWLTCALLWMHVPVFQHRFDNGAQLSRLFSNKRFFSKNGTKAVDHAATIGLVQFALTDITDDSSTSKFFRSAYIINMMFLPIGSIIRPSNDYERVAMMLIMVIGSLVVMGAAVASLALVISLYMRPEEEFRTRFRLIMDEMKNTHVPQELRDKVETFYRMFWHKQKAVSVVKLLSVFPPTLPCAIYTDIYFEAQQKSPILRDLSYQFLREIAKVMDTIHYIPGDAIIKRASVKSSIIFITYGDVEMLTAEDDETAILRFTRGTCLSSCAGHPVMACSQALVEIRAATFCTAHVLTADNLWRVAAQYGKNNGQAFILLSSFEEHIERVKRHFRGRDTKPVKHKSNIVQFKRNLMALKEAKDDDGNPLLARTDFFLEIAGCYIMRNRSDASLIDEADEICLRPTFPCILQPQSSLLVAWHSFVTVTHPYCLVFFENVTFEFRFYDYMVTLIFVLDLIVHLSTGAHVEEGVPITFAQTSTQQVRSFWFLLDALGTLPIFEFIYSGKFAGINKLLRLHKVFRMLKSMEEVCVYHSNALRLMSYSLFILILCYLIASLQQAYMCFVHGYCRVESLTVSPHWAEAPLTDHVNYRLVFSMYWAMSMLTFTCNKTLNWKPNDWRNLLYTASLLEGITIIYTCLEAMYSATIMVTTALKEDYDSTIANVKNFLVRNGVEPTLRHRFITYLELCWYTDKAYSMTQKKGSTFYDLPPHVYQDIVSRQRIKYILRVRFMRYIHKERLKELSSQAHLFYTSPNEILLSTGDINNEIFVIKQGMCEIYDPDTQEVCDTLGPTQTFGTLECLLRFPTYYTVRALTHVQIFAIPRRIFQDAIREPRIKDALEFVKKRPEYLEVQIRREPFLTYVPPSDTPNLSRFPLPRKYESDTDFLSPFISLGFLSFLRYIFPRFTIRPDGTYIYRYEWLRALCALTSSMIYPSYSYMVLQVPWLEQIAWILDLLAYFDVCQRMLVGYYNDDGVLVYHPVSTAAHYLKGTFLVDLLSCLPLEHLESSRDTTSLSPADLIEANVVSSIAQMLMLNRLLQLYRLPGAMNILSVYFGREDVILVIKSIPLFMVLLNVLTCFIVFASVKIYGPTGNTPWRIVPHNDPGGSWIDLFKNTYRFNITETPWNLHLTIYSWVVYETTSTGYNIFNPSNVQLMQVMILGMLVVSAMMITYFSVRIISIRANVNKMLARYQDSMRDISQFMIKEKLDKTLRHHVMAYYEYTWDTTGGNDSRNVLKLCDQSTLRTDAILHLYGDTFSKCPILYHCDLSLLRLVGRSVRSVHFLANTHIIHKNDVLTDMFFVDHGTIDIKESEDAIRPIVTLIRGSVFGNLENLRAVLSPNELYVSNNAHLLQINSMVFYRIILDFPTVKVLMKKYRRKNENYIQGRKDDFPMKHWKSTYAQVSMTSLSGSKSIVRYFNVNTRGAQYYFILVSLLCIYGDVYNAGFQFNHIALLSCLYILDMGFFIKILLNYILPFIVEAGDARNYLLEMRKRYFKSEFKYDIVSLLPIEFFSLIRQDELKWRLFAFLRLIRLFRIVTIKKCMKFQYSRLSTNLIFSTVATLVIWFSLFVHSSSCLWYAIGVIEDERKPGSAWFQKPPSANESVCDNLYICSVYFILTTFTQKGVGDVLPRMQSEVVFTIILQLISTMMFMIYVGEFSNIFQYQSFRSFGYYRKYLELKELLSNNRVSKNLVSRVEQYSLHLWRESRGVQMPNFLETAPPCFQLKIMAGAYMKHFVDHPAFKYCEPAFLRQLVGCLQLYTYSANNFVVKEGEITDSMYIVHRGRVTEYDEDMDTVVKDYIPGQQFGLMNGLTRDMPFTFTYKTCRKAEVLTLQLDAWEHLLHLFPKSRYEAYKDVPNHPYNKRPDDHSAPSERKKANVPVTHQSPEITLTPPSTYLTPSKIPTPAPEVPLPNAPAAAADTPWPLDSRDDGKASSFDVDVEQVSTISSESPRELAGKKEESKDEIDEESTDLEEPPPRRQTFMRRLTVQAKKLIGKESFDKDNITSEDIIKYDKSGVDKDTLLLDEDIKVTTALLQRFERKARKSVSEGFLEKSGLERFAQEHADTLHESILSEYIDKREAEYAYKATRKKSLAIRDYTDDDEYEATAVSRAPRRSVVMFGDDEDKPIRILPPIEAETEDQAPMPPLTSRRSIVIFGDNDIRDIHRKKDEEENEDEEKLQVSMAPRRSILISRELKSKSQYQDDTSEKEYPVNIEVNEPSTEGKSFDKKAQEVAESSEVKSSDIDGSKIAQVSQTDEDKNSSSKGIIEKQTSTKSDENEFLQRKDEKDKAIMSHTESKRPNLPIFIETDKDDKLPQNLEFDGSFPFPLRGRGSDYDDKTDIKDEITTTSTKDDGLVSTKSGKDTELLGGAVFAPKPPIEMKDDKISIEGSPSQVISPSIDESKGLDSEEKKKHLPLDIKGVTTTTLVIDKGLIPTKDETDSDKDTKLLGGPSRAVVSHKPPIEMKDEKLSIEASPLQIISPSTDKSKGFASEEKKKQLPLDIKGETTSTLIKDEGLISTKNETEIDKGTQLLEGPSHAVLTHKPPIEMEDEKSSIEGSPSQVISPSIDESKGLASEEKKKQLPLDIKGGSTSTLIKDDGLISTKNETEIDKDTQLLGGPSRAVVAHKPAIEMKNEISSIEGSPSQVISLSIDESKGLASEEKKKQLPLDVKGETTTTLIKDEGLISTKDGTDSDKDTKLLGGLSRAVLAHKPPIETKNDKLIEDSPSQMKSIDESKGIASEEKNKHLPLIHEESSNEDYKEKVQKPKSSRRISLYIPPVEEDIIEEEEMEEKEKVQEDYLKYEMLNRRASRRISIFAPPAKDQFNQDLLEELDEPMAPIAGTSQKTKLPKPKEIKTAVTGKQSPNNKSVDISDSQESIEGYMESKRDKKITKSTDETEKLTSRVRYEGDEDEGFTQPEPMTDQEWLTTPAPYRYQQRKFSEATRPTSTLTKEERNAMMMDSDLDPEVLPEFDKKPYDKKPKPKRK